MSKAETIQKEAKEGNVIISTIDGLMIMPIADFIQQPVEGILYDLNRDDATVLTFIDDPKWVNDYAVAQTIRALKSRIEELETDRKYYARLQIEADRERVIDECTEFKTWICDNCCSDYINYVEADRNKILNLPIKLD